MQGEGETDPCRGGETDPCRGRGRLIHAGGETDP